MVLWFYYLMYLPDYKNLNEGRRCNYLTFKKFNKWKYFKSNVMNDCDPFIRNVFNDFRNIELF